LFKHWDLPPYLLYCGINGIIYNSTKMEVIPVKIKVIMPEISTFQEFSNNLFIHNRWR